MEQKRKVGEIANKYIVSVSSDAMAETAQKLMKDSNLSLVPVLEDGRLVGIVTEELLRESGKNTPIKNVMEKPVFVEKDKDIDYAIKYVMRYGLPRVPVVDSSIGMVCIGMVTSSELLKAKKIQ